MSRPSPLRRVLKYVLIHFSERGTSYSLYRVLARLRFVLKHTRRRSRRLIGSTRQQRAVETKREPQLNRRLQLAAFEPFSGSASVFLCHRGHPTRFPGISVDGILIIFFWEKKKRDPSPHPTYNTTQPNFAPNNATLHHPSTPTQHPAQHRVDSLYSLAVSSVPETPAPATLATATNGTSVFSSGAGVRQHSGGGSARRGRCSQFGDDRPSPWNGAPSSSPTAGATDRFVRPYVRGSHEAAQMVVLNPQGRCFFLWAATPERGWQEP